MSEGGAHAAVNIAVDVGGSGVRVAVLSGDGLRLDSGRHFDSQLTDPARAAADFLLSDDVRELAAGSAVGSVLMGLSGLFGEVHDPLHAEIFARLRAELGVTELLICDDSMTAFFGALGGRPGVVSAVGTGIVTAAWDGGTRFRRIDGWGAVGGDRGSGYWIGMRGAQAALAMIDGRLASTAVRDEFLHRFGSAHVFARTTALGAPPKGYVADFAREILALAASGDPIANGIVNDAASNVASAIRSAEDQLGVSDTAVCLTGNAAAPGSDFETRIRSEYQLRAGIGNWRTSLGSPLDGAARLLRTPTIVENLSHEQINRIGQKL